ncbi:MAG TPA: response regulator [Polyangia bacterium]|jgi:two-component system response regulator|nr:response regulator [Polyangia bacterium]
MPRILLVEDNEDDIALTLRAFERAKLREQVAVARDGREALDFIMGQGQYAGREVDRMPELILLDLNLPKLGGLQVLEQLRQHAASRYVPVVVLTSSVEERDITESYRLGANSYVQKPVDFSQFLEATRDLGLYWLSLNRRVPPHVR